MLSIDGTFLIILVLFLVFMGLMNAIYFRPILNIKEEREASIEAGRQAYQDAADKTSKLSTDYQEQLAEARRKAQHLIQEKRELAKGNASAHISKAREAAVTDYEQQAAQLKESADRIYQELAPQREELSRSIIAKLSERQRSTAST